MGKNTTRQIKMMRAQSTTGRQRKSIQVHTAGIRGRRNESKFGVVEEKEGCDPEITIYLSYIRKQFLLNTRGWRWETQAFYQQTFILFLPENICREWRCAEELLSPLGVEVLLRLQLNLTTKKKKKKKPKLKIIFDLKATVQFNCTLNTMATVKKMGVLWVH